jgi:hypothetical protein
MYANLLQQPDEFCARHRILQPFKFTAADVGRPATDVYVKIAMLAVYPCARLHT